MVKNILEPEWDAVFEPNSYGFRCGRSCHDAIAQCFLRLSINPSSCTDKWVLDADISGFFDNIAHESILTAIESVPHGDLIEGWLKAGYLDNGVLNPTDTGTPQGGVISPLYPRPRLEVRLEPYDARVSCTVLRGGNRGDSRPLPAKRRCLKSVQAALNGGCTSRKYPQPEQVRLAPTA
jgi:retron-type reverse transcriptase